MSRDVTLRLPDDVWAGLADLADERGTRITDVLVQELAGPIRRMLRIRLEGEQLARRDARIRELNALGWSDRRIAPEVHLSHTAVKRRRDVIGLHRNYEPGGAQT